MYYVLSLLSLLYAAPVFAQTSISSPAVLWHATDCRATYTSARLKEQCGDLDDLSVFVCQLPQAGGNVETCDQMVEWGQYNQVSDGPKGDITIALGVWSLDANSVGTAELADNAVTDAEVEDTITASNYQLTDPDLTTLAGKTILGTGTDLRLSTGAFAADECVKVDANGNFATAGAACGVGGGPGVDDLQDVVTRGAVVTSAIDVASAVRIGSVDAGILLYCDAACQISMTDAQDLNWRLADTFDLNIQDNAGAAIVNFDETTKATTFSGAVVTSTLGIEYTEADAPNNPTCGAGEYHIYADLSENKLKKCMNTVVSDLDTTGVVGGVADNDYGDITVAGGAWAIDADAVTDAKVANDITASNYLPLAGGTLTDQLVLDNLAAEYEESDVNPTCAAGNFNVYADLSENALKKCVDGTASDLDTDGRLDAVDAVAPGPDDDTTAGYVVGSHWIHRDPPAVDVVYEAVDVTTGLAVWSRLTDSDTDDQTLDDVLGLGRIATGLTNEASAVVFGDGTRGVKIWGDAATGGQIKFFPDADLIQNAPATFDLLFHIAGDPVAKFENATKKLEYLGSGRPLKSVEVAGKEFGVCTFATAVVVAGKNKVDTFTCTTATTDGFDFDFVLPNNYDGGTVAVRLNAYSVNLTPANELVMTCSGHAVSDGDPIPDKSVAGEQSVTITFATQYKEEKATSNAITLNGTAAAGDHAYMHCDVDGATDATMADVRINAMAKIFYTVTGESE